jgi:hypothetical protein
MLQLLAELLVDAIYALGEFFLRRPVASTVLVVVIGIVVIVTLA